MYLAPSHCCGLIDLDADNLIRFLSSNVTSKGMANAFISGKDSERQTAGVMSTLANALKKISTERIFMTLSADEVPLDINNPKNPGDCVHCQQSQI